MFITLFGGVDVLLATADSILVMPFLVEMVKGIRDSISDALRHQLAACLPTDCTKDQSCRRFSQ